MEGASLLASLLEERGFRVVVRRASYRTLTGGVVGEVRVAGFRGRSKVVVALRGGVARVHVSVQGRGLEGLAEGLEGLGGSVDLDEAGLVAVFRVVEGEAAGLVARIAGLLP